MFRRNPSPDEILVEAIELLKAGYLPQNELTKLVADLLPLVDKISFNLFAVIYWASYDEHGPSSVFICTTYQEAQEIASKLAIEFMEIEWEVDGIEQTEGEMVRNWHRQGEYQNVLDWLHTNWEEVCIYITEFNISDSLRVDFDRPEISQQPDVQRHSTAEEFHLLCNVCQEEDHDACPLVSGCTCCADTLREMREVGIFRRNPSDEEVEYLKQQALIKDQEAIAKLAEYNLFLNAEGGLCSRPCARDSDEMCEICGAALCEDCAITCYSCESSVCGECVTMCDNCKEYVCSGEGRDGCLMACKDCPHQHKLCMHEDCNEDEEYIKKCDECGDYFCDQCSDNCFEEHIDECYY
jgi:hypothetical protein